MYNPFRQYFARFRHEKHLSEYDKKLMNIIDAFFAEQIPYEIIIFLKSFTFLLESIYFEQDLEYFKNKDYEKDDDYYVF